MVSPLTFASMMYAFCQSVYYASHNQSFPSTSEEKHEFWVGFGEHVGDAITQNLLHPTRSYTDLLFIPPQLHPSQQIFSHRFMGTSGSNTPPKPITFVKSHQDLDKSASRPTAEYNADDLIDRTPNQKGERYRASIKQKVIEISQELDEAHTAMVDSINFLLDVGQGRSQAIISYNQVLNYHEKENQDDETIYKFRPITNHHGALKKDDANYNGSLYNVMVEVETGEITEEPLSIIAKDDPATWAAQVTGSSLVPRNITYYTYLDGINSNT